MKRVAPLIGIVGGLALIGLAGCGGEGGRAAPADQAAAAPRIQGKIIGFSKPQNGEVRLMAQSPKKKWLVVAKVTPRADGAYTLVLPLTMPGSKYYYVPKYNAVQTSLGYYRDPHAYTCKRYLYFWRRPIPSTYAKVARPGWNGVDPNGAIFQNLGSRSFDIRPSDKVY
jgi:hypothetical protein